MRFAVVSLWFVTFFVLGCPRPPEPDAPIVVVFPDGAALDTAQRVCLTLEQIGCREGADPACVSTVRHVLGSHLTDLRTPCIEAARSRAEVRACGQPCR